jgi:3-hydroxybutyryl-CoA dehydrogenase
MNSPSDTDHPGQEDGEHTQTASQRARRPFEMSRAPETRKFARVTVVGAGQMGSGIAEVCARSGLSVTVCELDETSSKLGRRRIEASFDRAVAKGKLRPVEMAAALERIRFSSSLEACADAEIVLEAVTEEEATKVAVFRELDRIVAPEAILASNTSSIPIMKLGMATSRPQQVIGLHFFNPVPVMGLVELITSLHTSEEATATAEVFAGSVLGKRVIRSPDRAGFVVNALLVPYLLSAIRMLESGFASAKDIDDGMVIGCGHPMGPLELADLIGLDTTLAVAQSLYEEFKEPLYAPPPLLSRMVEAGLRGKKSGRGFHAYADVLGA